MSAQDKKGPVRDAAVAWAEIEYRNADSFSRTDLALTVNAWRAARKAALEEVRAELDYRYSSGGAALKGSYEAGQMTALDEMEGWVEKLMEKDA